MGHLDHEVLARREGGTVGTAHVLAMTARPGMSGHELGLVRQRPLAPFCRRGLGRLSLHAMADTRHDGRAHEVVEFGVVADTQPALAYNACLGVSDAEPDAIRRPAPALAPEFKRAGARDVVDVVPDDAQSVFAVTHRRRRRPRARWPWPE